MHLFSVADVDEWFLVQSRATPEGRGGCAIGNDLKSVLWADWYQKKLCQRVQQQGRPQENQRN